jgi:hypothetical protein
MKKHLMVIMALAITTLFAQATEIGKAESVAAEAVQHAVENVSTQEKSTVEAVKKDTKETVKKKADEKNTEAS